MTLRSIAMLLAVLGALCLGLAFAGVPVPEWVPVLGAAMIAVALTLVMAKTLFAMFPGSKQ